MCKKIIALVAIAAIIIGINQASALSLTKEGATEINAANFLADEGIIKDVRLDLPEPDPNKPVIAGWETLAAMEAYRLQDTITRKEVMKIVMKLSGKTVEDKCEGKFSDVPSDWGCKYIEAALKADYIAANKTFRPDDNITKTEAMKLVLKAKGIEKSVVTDNWQADYMNTAYDYGIISEQYTDYNADATRGWIFVITTATIEKEKEIKKIIEKKKETMTGES